MSTFFRTLVLAASLAFLAPAASASPDYLINVDTADYQSTDLGAVVVPNGFGTLR